MPSVLGPTQCLLSCNRYTKGKPSAPISNDRKAVSEENVIMIKAICILMATGLGVLIICNLFPSTNSSFLVPETKFHLSWLFVIGAGMAGVFYKYGK